MRRLTQKILSWICTLTLTASLGTAAFADTEDEVLPAEAAPFMEEPAADLPSVPEEDETADDVLAAPSSEFPTDKPETHAPETTPDGEEEEAAANEEETAEETDSQTVADAADGDAGDAALPLSDAVPGTAGIAAEDFSVQSVSEEETGNESGQTPSLEIGGSEVNLSEGGSGEGWSYDAEDGSLILVNCGEGVDLVASDTGVTIKAAGLNYLKSLTVDGDINLVGTGILLIDEIELGENSSFFLQPNSELYGEDGGSVAVFLKQEDGSYLLMNGSLPGILDEEYVIEGITLVIPKDASLLISSIGTAQDPETGEIIYYHPDEPSDLPSDGTYKKEESAGKLTIGQDAKLVVQTDAEIQMEHLASEIFGNCFITPLLNLVDNAVLELYGNVEGSGGVNIGEDTVLTGNGRMEGSEITVGAPEAINNADVTFSSGDMVLNGSGTLDRLQIEDSRVYVENSELVIDELISSGDDTLVLQTGAELHDVSVEDSLTLMGWERFTSYDESQTITLGGEIEGEVCLSSGFYDLSGANTENAVFSGASPAVSAEGQEGLGGISPSFLIDPGSLPEQTEDHQISVTATIMIERPNTDNTISFSFDHDVELDENSQTVTATEDGNSLLLNLDAVKAIADQAKVVHEVVPNMVWDEEAGEWYQDGMTEVEVINTTVVVELVYRDENGQIHVEFYKDGDKNAYFNGADNLAGMVDATDLVQVRIYCYGWLEKPDGSGTDSTTSTTFTGTGILSNGGADNVTGGNSTLIFGNNSTPDPDPDPDPAPDPDPDPAPDPNPDPDPKPTAETAAVRGIVVWAEPATDSQGVYVLYASVNGTELGTLVGRREVRMDYKPSDRTPTNNLYVVFRNTDGTLSAVKARYDAAAGKLIFTTGRLGRFVVVSLQYDGPEFSESFYEALGRLDEVKKLG